MSANNLKVLISGVYHPIYIEVLPQFEQESGLKVDSYLSPSMGHSPDSVFSRLDRGEPADVLIMAVAGLDDLVSKGMVEQDSRVELAVAPVGVAVKKGARRPDISTPEKLRQVLLDAKSVAYSISASGRYVSRELFKKLDIEREMKAKAHEVEGTTPVAVTIAQGTYEIGFQAISELGAVAGVDVISALPSAVAHVTRVAGAIAPRSLNRIAAAALLRFLSRPEFVSALKKHGLEPPENNGVTTV